MFWKQQGVALIQGAAGDDEGSSSGCTDVNSAQSICHPPSTLPSSVLQPSEMAYYLERVREELILRRRTTTLKGPSRLRKQPGRCRFQFGTYTLAVSLRQTRAAEKDFGPNWAFLSFRVLRVVIASWQKGNDDFGPVHA